MSDPQVRRWNVYHRTAENSHRQDPQCRLHGVTSQANVPFARVRSEPSQDRGGPRGQACTPGRSGGSGKRTTTTPARPLSEMTGFETRKGLMLLYEPESGDEWINKTIVKTEVRLMDTSTGEALNKKQAKAYATYLRRHLARNREGRQADRFVHIVDKY